MAIRDDWRGNMRERTGDSRTVIGVLVGVLAVLVLAFWLFTGATNENTGTTRTSAPTTTQPDTNKGGMSKQP